MFSSLLRIIFFFPLNFDDESMSHERFVVREESQVTVSILLSLSHSVNGAMAHFPLPKRQLGECTLVSIMLKLFQ